MNGFFKKRWRAKVYRVAAAYVMLPAALFN
jgi:hypothetical protein